MTPPVENMDAAAAACRAYSRQAVERFLKSVVVIDNEAYMGDAPPERGNSLDVGAVTKAFARHGINCSIYRPQEGDDIVATCLPLLRQADAAILDWELANDRDAGPCKELIKQLFTSDQSRGTPVRLIIIYTAEMPQNVFEALCSYLREADLDFTESVLTLSLHHSERAVICIQKKDENEPTVDSALLPNDSPQPVKPSQLPKATINAFSQITYGIAPSIALNAIAAVRERTHDMLGVFNKRIDKAFILQALLTGDAKSTYDFITNIIADEAKIIIANDTANDFFINNETLYSFARSAIHDFIYTCPDCNGDGYKADSCHVCSDGRDNCWLCDKSGTYQSMCKSCNGKGKWTVSKDFFDDILNKLKRKTVPTKHILDIIHNNNPSEIKGGIEFCRLACLSEESESESRIPTPRRTPFLQQGSILYKKKKAYICIMPPCDSVRINGQSRIFPFIKCEMSNNKEGASYVINTKQGIKYIILPPTISWKELQVISFQSDSEMIMANYHARDKRYFFFGKKADTNEQLTWLGTLRPAYATKLASDCLPSLGRVGIDDVEWLRRLKTS